jgi:CheY-like chemotaxis protein
MAAESILIVEDNLVNVKLFRVLLSKAGFDVRTALDAEEVFCVLSEFHPKLILMDVQLPGMDGLELSRRLKADPRFKDIIIVALTAYAMKGDRERALDAGCEGYIPKPIDTRTFVDSVREYLIKPTEAPAAQQERRLVLIADDDPVQREALESHLTQVGFEVIAARDGAEAIEKMRLRRPDIVVTDVLMPRLDGFRLTQSVRRDPAFSSVALVLMTSGAIRPGDEQLARSMGANSIVPRTNTFDEIVTAVRSALEQGPVRLGASNQQLLEELRSRFIQDGLRDSRHLLDTIQSEFDRDAAARHTHRWAGNGGTLGMPQISQAAFEMERMLGDSELDKSMIMWKLTELKNLFSAVARKDGSPIVPENLMASLSGKRFVAVGFDESEASRLSETLEQANALLRIPDALPAGNDGWAQVYDGVIVSVNEQSYESVHTQVASAKGKPLVAVGRPSATLEAMLNSHQGEHDFLLRPWNPSDLVLRCYTVISRSSTRPLFISPRAADSKSLVLIADSDPTTVALICMTLKGYNMECEVVSDGRHVIETASRLKPNLVVLDINMPQLDGFEILSVLKNSAATKTIPVVVLTTRQQESDVLRGFSLGAEDYVTKPFSPMELTARIKRILSRS